MAAVATQQVIHNGPRNLVLKYTIAGTTGDVTDENLVDISSLDSTVLKGGLRLDKAQWDLSGFSCKLAWDAGVSVDLLEMPIGYGEVDFTRFGGSPNTNTLQTGDVAFTTTGYETGEGGMFILHFKKKSSVPLTSLKAEPDTASLDLAGTVPTLIT